MPTSIPIQVLNRIYRRAYWRLTVGFSIFYVVALVAGLSLLVSNPTVGSWISDAAPAASVGGVGSWAGIPVGRVVGAAGLRRRVLWAGGGGR